MDADRIPVIVGVGQVNDRPTDPAQGLDSRELMVAALRAADEDGGGGWLPRLASLAVVDQISFRQLGTIANSLADTIGAQPASCMQTAYPSGDSPVLLLNEAANRIAAGEIDVAAVVGGEALRTASGRAALSAGNDASAHNASRATAERRVPAYRQRYGLTAPVDVYPLYENATRAAYGQTLAQGQAETGAIWSLFSQVAAATDAAWIRKPVTAEAVGTISADNRPIAFPYTKLMVANSSVNQGAAFLITSLTRARAHGVPEERLIYVGRGAAAHEPADFLARDGYDHSAGMTVSLRRTLALNDMTIDAIDFIELYSCFPCVPKMARRVVGWPLDKPATVFGGLTFGGGPIGNYMSHAVAGMVTKLRAGGRHGLLFGNGGFATNNHSIVIGRKPFESASLPHSFDFQAEADALRRPVPPLILDYTGPAAIETYTVFYARDGGVRSGVVVGRTPEGGRVLARIPESDTAAIGFLTDGMAEPVGSRGDITAEPEAARVAVQLIVRRGAAAYGICLI